VTSKIKEQVLSVMQGVANAWNHGNIPAATDFEPSLTVVDDTPPYLFQGPNAITDWIEAYRQEQPKDEKESKTSLHFLKPLTVEISGERAYVAVPGEWAVDQGGQTKVSHGIITVVLNRKSQNWRIATWVWTPR
jgi:hypothetical protein